MTYQQKKYKECKSKNICGQCHKRKSQINLVYCKICCEKQKIRNKQNSIKRKKYRLCNQCGKKINRKSISLCKKCVMRVKCSGAGFPVDKALRVLEKQNWLCAYTKIKLNEETASPDHIMPRVLGGTNKIDNLQWVHITLNRMKRDLKHKEFIQICRMVAKNEYRNIKRTRKR